MSKVSRSILFLSLKIGRLERIFGVDPFLINAPPLTLFYVSVLIGSKTFTTLLGTDGAGLCFIIVLTFDSTFAYFLSLVSFLAGLDAVLACLQLIGVSGLISKAEFMKLLLVEAVESLKTGNNSCGGDTI